MRSRSSRTESLPKPGDVRKPTVIVVGLIVLVVVFLLVTTHGKSCHYNVHFSKRLVCTNDAS